MEEKTKTQLLKEAILSQEDRLSEQITTRQVMSSYHRLNAEGRRKAMEYMDDLSQIRRYSTPEVSL